MLVLLWVGWKGTSLADSLVARMEFYAAAWLAELKETIEVVPMADGVDMQTAALKVEGWGDH